MWGDDFVENWEIDWTPTGKSDNSLARNYTW